MPCDGGTSFAAQLIDDETLFASFLIMRHRPHVVVVLRSEIQKAQYGIEAHVREWETVRAMEALGMDPYAVQSLMPGLEQWPFGDTDPPWPVIEQAILGLSTRFDRVIAPAFERGGHPHHNSVAEMAREHFDDVIAYTTYRNGGGRTGGDEVPFEPSWLGMKLRALACYESQWVTPSHKHFLESLREYVVT